MKIETNRTPRENQANERCDARLMPKNDGRARKVYGGFGKPVQSVLSMPGTVKHGVASTAFCMKMAKASVVTARKRPGHAQGGQADHYGDHRGHRPAVEHHQESGN